MYPQLALGGTLNTSQRLSMAHATRVVTDHCETENARTVDETLRREYRSRLDRALQWKAWKPTCQQISPFDREPADQYQLGAFDPSRVFVTDPATSHHTPDEIFSFALSNRGDSERHISAMHNLWVQEYPVPTGVEPVFEITTNGRHRRLAFQTIGMPIVGGMVDRCEPNWWRYEDKGNDWIWVSTFKRLGLIDELCRDRFNTACFHDPTGCVGWVFPSGATALGSAPQEIVSRMHALETLVGPVVDPCVASLRDVKILKRAVRATIWEIRRERLRQIFTK